MCVGASSDVDLRILKSESSFERRVEDTVNKEKVVLSILAVGRISKY